MTENNIVNLEDYIQKLAKVGTMHNVDSIAKAVGDNNTSLESRTQAVRSLGRIMADDPDFYLGQRDLEHANAYGHYQKGHKSEVEQATEQYGEKIFSDYIHLVKGSIEQGLAKTREKIEGNEEYQDLEGKQKEAFMNRHLSLNKLRFIAESFKDFELREGYEGELAESWEIYKAYRDAKGVDSVAELFVKDKGLPKNDINNKHLRNNYQSKQKQGMDIYGSVVAQKLLDKNGNIDEDKFKDAFGNISNYKIMSHPVMASYGLAA